MTAQHPWWRRLLAWIQARFRRGHRQIVSEVHETRQELAEGVEQAGETIAAASDRIGAEVREAGEKLLDLVDDLPLVGRFLRFPPVRNQFYGHGAFMGAAPELLADPRWRRILAFLMPDVFEDVRAALADGAGPARVIPMFENNPVLCAYGTWHGLARRREAGVTLHANDLAGMEWDIYMDGDKVAAWADAAEAGDDAARRRLRDEIVATTVIAHASTTDVVQEAAGVCQYEDVRTTAKTRLGGVEVDAWLDLFGRALDLADATDLDQALVPMRAEERHLEGDACVRYTFVRPRSAAATIATWRRVSGQRHLGVVLEVKSLRSTPALVRDVVEALNERGVWVRAVCAFSPAEVLGVSAMRQVVDGDDVGGPREIRFFHFAADLQAACDAGEVPPGQGVLFNGASLLLRTDDAAAPYRVHADVVDDLDAYRRRHGIDIGLYVQENDCDAAAAALLSALVEARPDTFTLGFAWGGLYDEAAIPADGEDRRGFGSQGMLAWVSRGWRLRDDDAPTDEVERR